MSVRWLTALLVFLSVALVVAVVVWLGRGSDSEPAANEPELVSATQLSAFADEHGKPVYWLGERQGAKYELTETPGGRVYLRYLRGNADAGDTRASFVTVATYPASNGVAALRRAAHERSGAELGRTKDGAVLLIDPSSPDNAHLAYPDADLQIEVYSPDPGEALRLAAKGDVRPVP